MPGHVNPASYNTPQMREFNHQKFIQNKNAAEGKAAQHLHNDHQPAPSHADGGKPGWKHDDNQVMHAPHTGKLHDAIAKIAHGHHEHKDIKELAHDFDALFHHHTEGAAKPHAHVE